MTKNTADPVAAHFAACLTRERKAGILRPTIALGDSCILLQLIRMKLDDFDARIDPGNPGRFRGTKVLKDDMRAVLGDTAKLHVPKWGASHVRGALRSDAKRGNKQHLIHLIELLNHYRSTEADLRKAYHACIRSHQTFWKAFALRVTVQKDDPFQKHLLPLLSIPSFGRVQQGLVYSTLKRKYQGTHRVTTKKTFAGDEQSSCAGVVQRGDVQVWADAARLLNAIEVKDAVVNQESWERVQATHGQHPYALFVLASGYHPAALQVGISGYASTYAIHLIDFLLTVLFTIAADEGSEPQLILGEVLDIYNDDFCENIELDSSLRITLQAE